MISANRLTTITVINEEGVVVKTVNNLTINFLNNNGVNAVNKLFDPKEIYRKVNRGLKRSPNDADIIINNIEVRTANNLTVALNVWWDGYMSDLKDNSKVTMKVYVTTCKPSVETSSKHQTGGRPAAKPHSHNNLTADNQENKSISNILGSPVPQVCKPSLNGSQTPSKAIASSARSKTPTNNIRSSMFNSQRTPGAPISTAVRQSTPSRATLSAKSAPLFMSPTQANLLPNHQQTEEEQPEVQRCESPTPQTVVVLSTPSARPKSSRKQERKAQKKAAAQADIDATWIEKSGSQGVSPMREEAAMTTDGPNTEDSSDDDYDDEEEGSEEEDEEELEEESNEAAPESTMSESIPDSEVETLDTHPVAELPGVAFLASTGGLGDSMRSVASTESSRNKKCKAAVPKTPTKPNSSSNRLAASKQVGGSSIYPNSKTSGEICSSHSGQLRKPENSRSSSKAALSTKKRAAQNQLAELSPVRCKAAGEGRPSIGTMTTQWEFMRTNFVGNNDEELEWMMVSKNPGAYRHAHRKNVLAEDRYFKSMHDTNKYEGQMKHVVGPAAKIPALLAEMAEHAKKVGITNLNPQAGEALKGLRATLRAYLESEAGKNSLLAFSTARKGIEDILVFEDSLKLARRTLDTHDKAISDVQSVRAALAASIRDGDQALTSMEKWAKRERETDDYAATMREEEEDWLQREKEANEAALAEMRSFVPVNVAEMTVTDLMVLASCEGLLSLELATEIKNNRLLHWVVTHEEDIACASFLSGDKKAFFENLEAYDIIELRALAASLPAKFENDNDGKKAEWRSRLIGRAKQLVSQANGDQVKGAWDEVLGRRGMTDMAPLKPDQERRAVYYYRTKEQSALRVKQYDEKNTLLLKKEGWLVNAETAAAETKTEYDTVLREMRDPDFLEQLTAQQVTQLTSVKDSAKRDWTDAESKRKMLAQEVARLRKTIADAPVSREQFLKMEGELERHLKFISDVNWSELGLKPIKIRGVFETTSDILKTERLAAKFSSAEEEAALRKKELTKLQNREESPVEAPVVADEVLLPSAHDDVVAEAAPSLSSSGAVAFQSIVGGGGVAAAIRDAESSASSGETQSEKFQTPRGKRNSVLNANPELLNTLNKMFSPPAGGAAGPSSSIKFPSSRRQSTIVANLFAADSSESEVVPKVKVVKKTQSKLLMKLLNNGVSPKKAGPEGGAPALSFLDQIKAKKAAAAGGGGAAPSFLDQLKGGFKGIGGRSSADNQDAPPPVAPMSFLDQIRMKKQKHSVVEEESSPPDSVPVAAPPVVAVKKMSFLESIQSRRVD